MYYSKTTIAGKTIRIKKYHTYANAGAPRSPRRKKDGPTPAKMAKTNHRNVIDKLADLLNCNFDETGTYHTLTYNDENYKSSTKEAQKDIDNFLRRLKYQAFKDGILLKYVYVFGYPRDKTPEDTDRVKRLHFHIVTNISCRTDMVKTCWKMGYVQEESLEKKGDYSSLAAYMIKNAERAKEYAISIGERIKQYYRPSRNLKKPEVIKHEISERECWEDPKEIQGYCIDKENVYFGVSWDGYRYSKTSYIQLNTASREDTDDMDSWFQDEYVDPYRLLCTASNNDEFSVGEEINNGDTEDSVMADKAERTSNKPVLNYKMRTVSYVILGIIRCIVAAGNTVKQYAHTKIQKIEYIYDHPP